MIDAPLALAFTAGLVATVNPCGFAMLPAYLGWFVGVEGDATPSPAARLTRALGVSGLISLTFVGVFGLAGVLVTAGALFVIDLVPWLAIIVGIGVATAGIAMLRGWKPVVALPQPSNGVQSRGFRSVVLFGLSYAIASLSCTLPVFLAVVAGTITSVDLASGVATFIAYGAGMSLVLVAVTLGVALARLAFVRRMRQASQYVDRAAAVLLVVAGAYIAFYWAFTLAAPVGGRGGGWTGIAEVSVAFVENLSTWTVNNLERWALPASVGLVGILVSAAWVATGRSEPREDLDVRSPGEAAGFEEGRPAGGTTVVSGGRGRSGRGRARR